MKNVEMMNAPIIEHQIEMALPVEIFRGLRMRQIKPYCHLAAKVSGQIAPLFNIVNDLRDCRRALTYDRVGVEGRGSQYLARCRWDSPLSPIEVEHQEVSEALGLQDGINPRVVAIMGRFFSTHWRALSVKFTKASIDMIKDTIHI
jgi:hypothetical protein